MAQDAPPPTDPCPDPAFVALHDQAAAEVRAKAKVVAAYYHQLRAEGVPEYEALELARDFQFDFLSPIREERQRLHDEREQGDGDPD